MGYAISLGRLPLIYTLILARDPEEYGIAFIRVDVYYFDFQGGSECEELVEQVGHMALGSWERGPDGWVAAGAG